VTGDELKAQAIAWFGTRGWQTELAARLGIDRTTVWRYIDNDMVPGPVIAAVRCWQAHGVPPDGPLK
jgi:DNA-binding transcriptional regulator LsrR (DeoR family)